MGKTAGIGAASAALMFLLSGCADADLIEVCADGHTNPVRADDVHCENATLGYGYYYWQINPSGTTAVPAIGQPLPRVGTPGAGSFTRPSVSGSTYRAPAAGSPNITRGGLGGFSSGSSGS